MANSTTDLVFRLSSITGLGMRDINGNDAEPQGRPGAISIVTDDFGVRILKYIRNVNGSAITMGELHSYASDTQNTKTTTVSNITSGTTTSAVTTGLTASRHQGGLCYVLDNGDPVGAGANLVNLFGSDGHELWIGTAPAAATNDIVSDSILVHLQLFSTELSGGTP